MCWQNDRKGSLPLINPEGPHLEDQRPETSHTAGSSELAHTWCWSVALPRVHLDGLFPLLTYAVTSMQSCCCCAIGQAHSFQRALFAGFRFTLMINTATQYSKICFDVTANWRLQKILLDKL